jgi:tRNA 2-thiouridine synthesizing protein A
MINYERVSHDTYGLSIEKECEMDIKVDVVQDSIGQLCPMPIAFLARNVRKMESGQVLEIWADDEGAHADIPAWCEQTGNEFLGEQKVDGFFKYYVKKTV